ncbi:protein phosphatase 2C domain-containing protein [Nocardia sp. NPDC127526]|uniref:protein phosphatase 2C domain-containing protein n=1 Tax=Nocardia sp. NPDC127526 TaxID=3345393 RepID=UPI0036365D51
MIELPTTAPLVGEPIEAPAPRLSGSAAALPGIRADAGLLADRWLAAASVAGHAHQSLGATGQDSYRFALSVDGSALALVVCNGLGGYPHTSQLGADLFARLGGAAVAEIGAAEADARGAAALAGPIERVNAMLIDEFSDIATADWAISCLRFTTLVCRVPLSGDRPALVARVGGGELFLLHGDRYTTALPAREPGPANVVRASLPHARPASVLELAEIDLGAADLLVLATGGLAGDIFDSPAVRSWLSWQWSVHCGPARMLDSLRYRRQGSHDDRTAIALWLRGIQDGDAHGSI